MMGWPKVTGAGRGGFGAAKLAAARKTPMQQRLKAAMARGLKRPDCEVEFFFMGISFVSCSGELLLTIRKLRPGRMPMSDPSF
jgi:hypothetical protein